ncbi:MAG: hypothetical protein MJZ16_02985 [Bacteroidales bacterium]|nr:hypothetical protein [Bacteroidales bacterium]
MKKKILIGILDAITGFAVGAIGYRILNHYANTVDWCILVLCVIIMAVRIYTLIKSGDKGK